MPSTVSGLAKVYPGWSGTLTCTIGAVTVSATFLDLESAPGAWFRFLGICSRRFAGTWDPFVTSAGKLSATVSGAGAFSFGATGTAATRLGITGAIAGSDGSTVEAQDAHPDGVYPTHGILLDVVDVAMSKGACTASDGYASAGVRDGSSVSVTVHDTLERLWTTEQTLTNGATYDAIAGDRLLARLFLTRSRRQRLGKLATAARLTVTGTTVGGDHDP